MSRIDEALRQAGRKTAPRPSEEQPASLESFPQASEPEQPFEPQSFGPEPADIAIEHSRPVPLAQDLIASHRDLTAERLVTHRNTDTIVVEQYRRLAGVLHQAQVDRGVKVVMLASAQPAEGKTLTAVNLALTLSESYKRRVLLIDADLRRPSVARVFGVPLQNGLSECLKTPELQSLKITNVSESLGLLLAGHADRDPMSGLTSGRMQEIINLAAASFDWVILDTPPVGLLTDAHLLSAMVDAAILVIDAGTTQHAVVQRAIESIGREKIVGVVLNRVEDRALAEASYYEYYGGSARARRRRRYLSGRSIVADVPEAVR
jgi:capsular exopolysaccharide synthesis family protein